MKELCVNILIFLFALSLGGLYLGYLNVKAIEKLEETANQQFLECAEHISENSARLDRLEAFIQEQVPLEETTEAESYDEMAARIAASYNLDPYLVRSVVWCESGGDPSAVNYDGSCVGLMQISKRWNKDRADDLGITDFFDPESNITLGCDILNEFINEKGYTPELALMLYNMNHDKAFELYNKGVVSEYAQKVLRNAKLLRDRGD